MPLTEKGAEILANMKKQYGAEKGERVFYASKNAGTISAVDSARSDADDALHMCAAVLDSITRRMDSMLIRQRTGHERSMHDDAEMKEGAEIKFKNHVIRCTGSMRGKVYTVFGPKRGSGNSYIGEAGTLEGAKAIASGNRNDSSHEVQDLPKRSTRRRAVSEDLSCQLNLF